MKKCTSTLRGTAILLSCWLLSHSLNAQSPMPESEPNGSRALANLSQTGQIRSGQISGLVDVDMFRWPLAKGAYKAIVRYPQGTGPNGVRDWFELWDAQDKKIVGYCVYPPDGSHVFQFQVCSDQEVLFRIQANTDLGLTNKPYEITIVPDADDPDECNGTLATARVIAQSGTYKGKIALEAERDFILLKNMPVGEVEIKVSNTQPGDPRLLIALGKVLPQSLIVQAPAPGSVVTIKEKIAQAGDYYIAIQFEDAVVASGFPYEVVVLVKPACTLNVDESKIKTDSAACPLANGRIEIPVPTTGTAPYQYRLGNNPAQPSPVFANLANGNYRVIVSDNAGCHDTLFIEVACKPCPLPQVGISVLQNGNARQVDFSFVAQNGTLLEWNFGDGNTSKEAQPSHTYATSGIYNVLVTVQNPCGTATATATITVLTGKFALGNLINVKTPSEIKVPLYVVEGEGTMMSLSGSLPPDSSKFEFKGFLNGSIPVQGQTLAINSAQGRFSFVFNSNGFPYKPNDTLMYLVFKTKPNLPPGDSILLDLTKGPTPFEVLSRIGNVLVFVDASFVPGRIDIVRRVKIQVKAQGPKGNNAKGRVYIQAGGKETIADTDLNGSLNVEVDYNDAIFVYMQRDTIVQDGINIVDVVIANRMYVGLTTIGETIYSQLAVALFDGNNKFNSLDIAGMMNFLVGNITFPKVKQFVFIPSTHVMPPYSSPDYYKYPTRVLLTKPDPSQTAQVAFVVVQAGDVDHSNPNLNRSHTIWHYEEQADADGFVTVLVYAGADAAQGAQLDLRFDNNYTFVGAETLQSNTASAFNPSSGRLRAALLQNGDFDPEQPLLALRFRATHPNNGRTVILPASAGHAADHEGNASEVSFQSLHTLSGDANSVWPNPANKLLQVRCAQSGSHTLELFDTAGKLRHRSTVEGGDAAEISVETLPAGPYLLKIQSSKGTSVQRVVVAH